MKTCMASRSRLSFTLVEMLVAIAVLSILLLLIFSIVESSVSLSDSTSRRADSSIEARQVLDRIGADIDNMLIRPDVDQFYYSGSVSGATPENDKMFFYSQQTGFFDSGISSANQSPVSLIGYRINTTDNAAKVPMLERLAQGLILDYGGDSVDASGDLMDPNTTTGPLVYLTFPARTSVTGTVTAVANSTIPGAWGPSGPLAQQGGGTSLVGTSPFDNGSSPYYDAIGPDVFRFEVCFLLQNGTFSLNPGYINSAPVYGTSIANTVAIVAAIAILDSKSRKLVPATSWTKLIKALPNPTATGGIVAANALMDTTWNNALNSSTFAATAGIPSAVASHIKVYQRYYYLNTPKTQ